MDWHNEFPQAEALVYLNHAAVSPWPKRSAEAVAQFATENLRFGGRDYSAWLNTENALREKLARLINAASVQDIALQKNTSEALSVIAYGLPWRAGDNVIISNQEFPSNRIVWESLASRGVQVKVADLTYSDSPESAVIELIDNHTRLISISSVQYATGLKMNCQQIGDACRHHGVLFCVDAIQSLGAHSFDARACHADFVVADGHKWMMGPEGLALFYSTPEARDQLTLQQYGWHMVKHRGDYDRQNWEPATSAQRFECGSPNMLGAYALNASLSLIEEVGITQLEQALMQKLQFLMDALQMIDQVEIVGEPSTKRRAGILTFKHPAVDPARLHKKLLAANIICACRGGGIRFSPHFYTPPEKLQHAVSITQKLLYTEETKG